MSRHRGDAHGSNRSGSSHKKKRSSARIVNADAWPHAHMSAVANHNNDSGSTTASAGGATSDMTATSANGSSDDGSGKSSKAMISATTTQPPCVVDVNNNNSNNNNGSSSSSSKGSTYDLPASTMTTAFLLQQQQQQTRMLRAHVAAFAHVVSLVLAALLAGYVVGKVSAMLVVATLVLLGLCGGLYVFPHRLLSTLYAARARARYDSMLRRSDMLPQPVTTKHTCSGESATLAYGCSCMQGWRRSMEDAHTLRLLDDGDGFFGVYDGHSGAGVARFCGEHMYRFVTQTAAYAHGRVREALIDGFVALDKHLYAVDAAVRERSGCTAVVLFVHKDKLYCANAGDSRCVLCRHGVAEALSVDHKPEVPHELARIERAGAFVQARRVNGALALSRAIGDFAFKTNRAVPWDLQAVTSAPQVITRVRHRDADEFVVLACDGIWDCMSNDEVVAFVRARLQRRVALGQIAEELMQRCLSPVPFALGCDNMSVIIVQFKRNAAADAAAAAAASSSSSSSLSTSATTQTSASLTDGSRLVAAAALANHNHNVDDDESDGDSDEDEGSRSSTTTPQSLVGAVTHTTTTPSPSAHTHAAARSNSSDNDDGSASLTADVAVAADANANAATTTTTAAAATCAVDSVADEAQMPHSPVGVLLSSTRQQSGDADDNDNHSHDSNGDSDAVNDDSMRTRSSRHDDATSATAATMCVAHNGDGDGVGMNDNNSSNNNTTWRRSSSASMRTSDVHKASASHASNGTVSPAAAVATTTTTSSAAASPLRTELRMLQDAVRCRLHADA